MFYSETRYRSHGLLLDVPIDTDRVQYDVFNSTFFQSQAAMVLDALRHQSYTVEELAEIIGLPQSDIEQQLQVLYRLGSVKPDTETFPDTLVVQADDFLEVYLELTRNCNLHCFGCATDASPKQKEHLSVEQAIAAVRLSLQSAHKRGMKRLKLKVAGGEPSLPKAFAVLHQLQAHLPELQAEYPEIEIEQVLLTNGTLLDEEKIILLKEWNMRVSVSLWGIGEQNSLMRGMAKNGNQFDRIIEGLRTLHEHGISFNVNHVITPDNAAYFADFIRAVWDLKSDMFIGKGWYDQPFGVGINFLRPQNDIQLRALTEHGGYEQMVVGIREAFVVIHELLERGVQIPSLDWDYLQLNGLVQAPCGTGFNYLAVGSGANGQMVAASCHESMRHPSASLITPNTIDVLGDANEAYENPIQLLGPNVARRFAHKISRPILAMLALHGGTGCPHDSSRSIVEGVYTEILPELLSLEYMRRRLLTNQLTSNN